ncbi:MAG: flagellar hook-basal body complex protein FliE [Pseudobdellovibrio sp.]
MDGLTISNANKFIEAGGIRSTQNEHVVPNGDVAGSGKTFADTLKDAIGNVNELQKTADIKAQELATGKTDDIAGVMLATEKADIALRTMVQVRNKIIDAYQEIMRMQV